MGGVSELGESDTFRARPPAGIDPIGSSTEGASVYQLIREDIVEGRLKPNERLVAADLARRHGTSTNPVREALQLTKVLDADRAAETIARHVEGSGRHVLEQMRARDAAMVG